MSNGYARFHIGKNGPSECNANEIPCPLLKEGAPHFEGPDAKINAEKWYDKAMDSEKFKSIRKRDQNTNSSIRKEIAELNKVWERAKLEKRKLTQREASERHLKVEKILEILEKNDYSTERKFSFVDEGGDTIYTDERRRQHAEIISELLNRAKNVPAEGKVVISGGLGGAGKSTVLKDHVGLDTSKYVTINPDDIKEIMAENGMIPVIKGLSPMEVSPLAHEEASYISKLLEDKISKTKRNIIVDVTMSNEKSVKRRLKKLYAAGYKSFDAVFVDIKPETSLMRGRSRYHKGMNSYMENEGYGGRILPEQVVMAQVPDNKFFNSKNAEVLISCYDDELFTSKPRVFDNNKDGGKPLEIDYDEFVGEPDYIEW